MKIHKNGQTREATAEEESAIIAQQQADAATRTAEEAALRVPRIKEAMFNNNAADFARVKSIGTNDGTLTSIEGISLKRSSGNWGTSGSVKLYGRAA